MLSSYIAHMQSSVRFFVRTIRDWNKLPFFPWPVSRECIPQEPGRIEYYNQLFCLRGHLGGVSEIQTSLDVSDL